MEHELPKVISALVHYVLNGYIPRSVCTRLQPTPTPGPNHDQTQTIYDVAPVQIISHCARPMLV
jgi:hypothetical protein